MSTQTEAGGNGARLAIYWLIVGIPLIWGIVKTLINAAQLFG
jgi:hypothetical protein